MSAYSSAVLADSPLLYWRLGESAGTTAVDASGNARDGTYAGGFTLSQPGALTGSGDSDTAVDFNGSTGQISSSYKPWASGVSRTVDGWAWRDLAVASTNTDGIFGTHADNRVTLRLVAGSNDVLFGSASSVTWTNAWAGSAQWVYFAVTYNDTTGNAELFINGVSKGVLTIGAPFGAASSTLNFYGATDLDVGAGGNVFDGKIDEIAIYPSVLSSARILAHYNAGITSVAIASPQDYTPEDALAVSITTAEGVEYRWGPDEPDAAFIPQSVSFGTAVPGGFTTATITLSRRIDQDFPDLNLFDDVVIYGPGNETAWEGRVAQLPRSHGDDFSIQVGCVGWSAHLKDDPSFREIYVDVDFGDWGDPSVQRQIILASTGVTSTSPSASPDTTTGAPSLETGFLGAWTTAGLPMCEATYSANGIQIGSIYYAWKKNSNVNVGPDNFQWDVRASSDDILTASDVTGDLQAAGPGSGTLTASAGRYFAMARLLWNTTAAGNQNALYAIYWTRLAVYGTHNLTKQGTEDATNSKGFYASDVIADVISRAAPKLNYTAGTSIQATTFVIPQLAFKDPVTAEDAIMAVNAYHLWEWGVYEDKTFFYRQPDPSRLTWEVRLSDGAQLDLEGDAGDAVYNGVFVRYTDPTGVSKTVGPPSSGADATDASLYDTTTTNPVNSHGIAKRWAILDISQTTTPAGAIQLGAIWLAEQALPQRRGQVVITGTAKHPTAGNVPAWKIRAGDYIVIADHSANVARRVIDTSYSGNAVTCSLDNASSKLEAILDRLGFMVFKAGPAAPSSSSK